VGNEINFRSLWSSAVPRSTSEVLTEVPYSYKRYLVHSRSLGFSRV